MITLRVVRHDRSEQLLATCQSPVVPARGEALQLDQVDERGEPTGSSTVWRVVWVTIHVPSVRSAAPADGSKLCVRTVEVGVQPDISLLPEFAAEAEQVLSESRM